MMNFHPNNQHLRSFYRPTASSTPSKSFTHQLDPNSTPFQPTGMEMQRYQQLPPTPPSSNPTSAGEMTQMRNYLLSSHFAHTKDMVGLQRAFEREAESNLHEIESIKSTVKKDLQTLQAQIEDLKAHTGTKNDNENATTQQSNERYSTSLRTEQAPDFTGSGLAEIYLEEANTLEATAANLRKQATQWSDGESVTQPNMMKLLEDAKDLAEMSKAKSAVEFACCGMNYKSINELLEHVRGVHRCEQENISTTEVDATPTHVPARRSKPVAECEIKPEDQTTRRSASSEEAWVPLAVRQMPTAPRPEIEKNMETFSWELINNTFHGKQWSPGFYFISEQTPLKSQSYWILESQYEPFLPKVPGQHGAKLTAFFNDTEPSDGGPAPDEINFYDVPVFIRLPGQQAYAYYGNYSQTRFSDRVDYDNLLSNIPDSVLKYWAQQLSELGRPDWVSEKLINHLWPMPAYCGPIPTDSAVATPVTAASTDTKLSEIVEKRVERALRQYALELKEWKKETDMKVRHLTAENLLQAFKKADADEEPGLRLFWEYLQFEKYDQKCYDFLVDKKKPKKAPARSMSAQKATAGVKTDSHVQPGSDAGTIVPDTPTKLKRSTLPSKTLNWSTGTGHKAVIKPREQTTQTTNSESTKPAGDLQAAKDFQASVEKHFAPGIGRSENGKIPPHLRNAK